MHKLLYEMPFLSNCIFLWINWLYCHIESYLRSKICEILRNYMPNCAQALIFNAHITQKLALNFAFFQNKIKIRWSYPDYKGNEQTTLIWTSIENTNSFKFSHSVRFLLRRRYYFFLFAFFIKFLLNEISLDKSILNKTYQTSFLESKSWRNYVLWTKDSCFGNCWMMRFWWHRRTSYVHSNESTRSPATAA